MRRISKAGTEPDREAGYTYVSVLAVLVAAALSAQTAFIPAESARIRDAEAELLFRGAAYREAIEAFWAAGGSAPRLPRSLDELRDDPRGDGQRHIRQLYGDPITDRPWTLIRGNDGGISGVASTSTDRPRRRAFFPAGFEDFEAADSYADWTFEFTPG